MKTRFQGLISGACPTPLYDTILWDLGDVVVTPTLGSIIPHWVLAVPRSHAVNFSLWCKGDRWAPPRYIREIARRAGKPTDEIIWFEHGPAIKGAVTGCGVDHAHIHLLLKPEFEFAEFSEACRSTAPSLKWQKGFGNPYDYIAPSESYLIAAEGDRYLLAQDVDSAGSQFFRRIVANLTAQANSWDYRTHPHLENVRLTVASARQAA